MKHFKVHYKTPKTAGWVVVDANSEVGASCQLWKTIKDAKITKVYQVENGY